MYLQFQTNCVLNYWFCQDVLNWMYTVAIPVEGFDYLSATGSYGYALGLGAAFFNGKF